MGSVARARSAGRHRHLVAACVRDNRCRENPSIEEAAFTAILDQEQHRLGRVQPLIAELRLEIEQIGVAV